MVDGNKLGDVGFQRIGTPYSEMDCQAFVEWCLRQCGCNKNLAGSNAWYREVKKNGVILTPEECVKQLGCVPKGAFLFIHANDGGEEKVGYHDGQGNASHIGICTIPRGEGAINSSKSRGGVCESKFKQKSINGGWNRVGLWNQVAYDYSGGVDPVPDPEPKPEPEPKPKQTAIVGNVPAGNRQDVNMRASASTAGRLIERVPCGSVVEILEAGTKWCKIRWKNLTGYIMTQYLLIDEEVERYTIILRNCTAEMAESIREVFPEAEIKKEGE